MMVIESTIAQQIRQFVASNFLYGQSADQVTDDQSFLDTGVIDSTGVLELVAFVEQEFGIAVADRELVPDNLDSIARVARFVTWKLDGQARLIDDQEVTTPTA